MFDGRVAHWGVAGHSSTRSSPLSGRASSITCTRPRRPRARRPVGRPSGSSSFWWQFLLAGAIAAVIALVIARWLARGMTQPLRDMAAAARRMETGDYSTRVTRPAATRSASSPTAFNRMSEELENLEPSRRDLVANVSHELKTPITAMRAHLENLLDGVEQPDPRRSR